MNVQMNEFSEGTFTCLRRIRSFAHAYFWKPALYNTFIPFFYIEKEKTIIFFCLFLEKLYVYIQQRYAILKGI